MLVVFTVLSYSFFQHTQSVFSVFSVCIDIYIYPYINIYIYIFRSHIISFFFYSLLHIHFCTHRIQYCIHHILHINFLFFFFSLFCSLSLYICIVLFVVLFFFLALHSFICFLIFLSSRFKQQNPNENEMRFFSLCVCISECCCRFFLVNQFDFIVIVDGFCSRTVALWIDRQSFFR